MKSKLKCLINSIFPSLFAYRMSKISFSQNGEDLLIQAALAMLGIKNPKSMSYLDIGANHPFSLSNTYKFYREGGSGILVEPDPILYKRIGQRKT